MTGPLDGVRVLDLSRVMSGPFASAMLADLGADVVKVEAAGTGDIMRHMGGHQRGGVNAIFLGLNRGKRSLAVDLRDPAGVELLRELASAADVLVENFRPGVCASMGLGPDDLLAANPRLVYVSISGFGTDSPSSAEPAYDTMIQGRSGLVARQKRGASGTPDLVRSYVVDKVAGFFAVQAVLAALLARGAHGDGQFVSVPMFDATLYYLWPDGFTDVAFVGGDVSPGTIFPLAAALTETADGFITHLAISDKERAAVARAVDRPELNEDPRFTSTAEWVKPDNRRAYERVVGKGFEALTSAEAIERLRAEGVPCAPIAEPADVVQDHHVVESGVLDEWAHPRVGHVRQVRHPVRFADEPGRAGRTAPALGEHTVDVLTEYGIAPDRIAELLATGAVHSADM